MALDFSGYKALAVGLLNQGKEEDLRQALKLLGKLPADIDQFILDTQQEKVNMALSADRKAFTDNCSDCFAVALPEIDGQVAESLAKLTENWTKMPSFTIALQRSEETDKDSGIKTVIFTWAKISKWGSASSVRASKPEGESNGVKEAGLKPPAPYTTWQAVANALIPDHVKAYSEKHGGIKGLNARRLIGNAIKNGGLALFDGFTLDQLV